MLTLTDTWQIIARQTEQPIAGNRRFGFVWDYKIGDHRTVAGLRATGRIVTVLRREPGGALVMVGSSRRRISWRRLGCL